MESSAQSQSLGQLFKQTRLQKNLTYDDIYKSINISPTVIENLENDDFSHRSATSFTKGYIRSYAKFLQIEENIYIPLLKQCSFNNDPELKANPLHPLEDESFKKPWVVRIGLVIGLIILISLALWWYMSYENTKTDRTKVINEVQQTEPSEINSLPLPSTLNFNLPAS